MSAISDVDAFVARVLALAATEPVALPAGMDPAAVVSAGRRLGARAALLAAPSSRLEFLDGIAAGLDLPTWFGRNWDALEELLGSPEPELSGPVLVVWESPEALGAADAPAFQAARSVLGDAAVARRARGAGPLVVLLAGRPAPPIARHVPRVAVHPDPSAGSAHRRPSSGSTPPTVASEEGVPMLVAVPSFVRSVGRVHHVAVVVRSMDVALGFYRDTLGLAPGPVVPIPSDRVNIAFLPVGEVKIELVEPLDDRSGVARFLASRGEGFHHLCFEVPDISAALTRLGIDGVELIDSAPRPGAEGPVAFLHPRSCHGVLVELIEAPGGPAWTSLYPNGFRAPGE